MLDGRRTDALDVIADLRPLMFCRRAQLLDERLKPEPSVLCLLALPFNMLPLRTREGRGYDERHEPWPS